MKPKVAEQRPKISVEQNILRFQSAVHDAVKMEKPDSLQNLLE
jgi:hypothetical protein